MKGTGFYHFSKFHCSKLPVSEIAKVVYCCFTITTLFTTIFTVSMLIEKQAYNKFCLE